MILKRQKERKKKKNNKNSGLPYLLCWLHVLDLQKRKGVEIGLRIPIILNTCYAALYLYIGVNGHN